MLMHLHDMRFESPVDIEKFVSFPVAPSMKAPSLAFGKHVLW